MAKSQSLQDPFLNALRKEKVPGLDLPGERHQAARARSILSTNSSCCCAIASAKWSTSTRFRP